MNSFRVVSTICQFEKRRSSLNYTCTWKNNRMMSLDEMWNIRRLPPPNDTVKVDINPSVIGCVEKCIKVFSNAADILKEQNVLGSEQFVLSRFLVKRKSQIRRHKVKQVLAQVESCLKRYQETDLAGYITTMHQYLQQARISQQRGGVVRLPSKGMFQFTLVRLMGVATLLVQTVNYCVRASMVLETDVKLAHLLPQTMLCLATVSRIWACCRSLYLDCVEWYHSLLPSLNIMPQGQPLISQTDSDLPTDLVAWLGNKVILDNMSREPHVPSVHNSASKDIMDMQPASVAGGDVPEMEAVVELQEPNTKSPLKHKLDEDIGAPVKRAKIDLGIKCEKKSKKKSKKTKVNKKLNKESHVDKPSSTVDIKMEEDTLDIGDRPGMSLSVDRIKSEPQSSDESVTSYQPVHVHNIKVERNVSDEDLPIFVQNIKTEKLKMEKDFNRGLTSPKQSIKTERNISCYQGPCISTNAQVLKRQQNSSDYDTSCDYPVSIENIKTERIEADKGVNSGKSLRHQLIKSELDISNSGSPYGSATVKIEQNSSDDQLYSTLTVKKEQSNNVSSYQSSAEPHRKEKEDISDNPADSNSSYSPQQYKNKRSLKQCISKAENMETLIDIFLSLRPQYIEGMTVWDHSPRLGFHKKQDLFETTFMIMQNCKYPRDKQLAKGKLHCFSYLKALISINTSSVAEIIDIDTVRRFIQDLSAGKLVWLGSTTELTEREAIRVKNELEVVLRKLVKVNVRNTARLNFLHGKAGKAVLKYFRRAEMKRVKENDRDENEHVDSSDGESSVTVQ